jgi:hypothetical protein
VNVDFEVSDMGQHVRSSVIVSADTGVLARLQDRWKAEKEFTVLERELPNVQFFIGPVPVVIANSLSVDGTLSADLEYKPEVGLYYGAGKEFGYIYDNTDSDKLRKINESTASFEKSFSPDSTSATADFNVGINVSIQSLLYGSSGLSGSADVKTYLKGTFKDNEIKAGVKTDAGLSADLIVNIPVIDHELVNTVLWESERAKLFPTDREWYNLLDPEDMELSFGADIEAIAHEIVGEYFDFNNDVEHLGFIKIYNDDIFEIKFAYVGADTMHGNYIITEKPNGTGYAISFSMEPELAPGGNLVQPFSGIFDIYVNVDLEEAIDILMSHEYHPANHNDQVRNLYAEVFDAQATTFPITFLTEPYKKRSDAPTLWIKIE